MNSSFIAGTGQIVSRGQTNALLTEKRVLDRAALRCRVRCSNTGRCGRHLRHMKTKILTSTSPGNTGQSLVNDDSSPCTTKPDRAVGTLAVLAAFAITANIAASPAASAGDWPQWRGPNRDGHASDFKVPATWPTELTKKWKVAVGEGDSTPALVGEKLFVFSRGGGAEVTRCLETSTGKELWQEKHDALAPTGPAAQHSGPRSSPAVADGKVVTYGVRGTLSCFDTGGKLLWRKEGSANAWPSFFTSSSPMIADGVCIAQLGGPDDGSIVALDLAAGAEKWKWTGDGAAYASPLLVTVGGVKMVVAETDKQIVGVSLATGKVLFQMPFAGSGMGGMNSSTPSCDGQTLIFSGSGRGTRAAKIEKQGDAFAASEAWKNPDNSVQHNSPILKNGLVFGLTSRDALFCINAKDGKTAWTSPITGRRGFGSLVDAGSVLALLTPTANLVFFEPSDKEFKQLATFKVADTDTYAHPILSGNQLIVKDKDSVTLWTIE